MVTKRQIRNLKKLVEPDEELMLFVEMPDDTTVCVNTGEQFTPEEWEKYQEESAAEGDPVVDLGV